MTTRWGCVGLGKIASDFFTAVKDNLPSSEHQFAAVASRDLSRSKVFADKFGFKRAYGSYQELAADPDIDVVYIATLNTSHAELTCMMLNAGKHVLCEKPMGLNSKQVKQVTALAKEKKLFFMEGFWTRFFPVYQLVRKELDEGVLGDVRLIQASFCMPISGVDRVSKKELGGGALMDIGVYVMQLACFVFDEMPETIRAEGNMNSDGVDTSACIILKYKKGEMLSGNYHIDAGVGYNRVTIQGTQGKMEIDPFFWCSTRVTTPSGVHEFPMKAGDYNFDNSAGFQFEANEVHQCLQKGKLESSICPHRHSEIIMATCDDIRRQLGVTYPDD